jgi:hypothetical protein
VPLFAHTGPEATCAHGRGTRITAGKYPSDVSFLAAGLPQAAPFLDRCTDLNRFAVGLPVASYVAPRRCPGLNLQLNSVDVGTDRAFLAPEPPDDEVERPRQECGIDASAQRFEQLRLRETRCNDERRQPRRPVDALPRDVTRKLQRKPLLALAARLRAGSLDS